MQDVLDLSRTDVIAMLAFGAFADLALFVACLLDMADKRKDSHESTSTRE